MEHFNLEPHPGIMKTAVDIVCPLYLQLHIPRFSQPRIQQYILIGKKKKKSLYTGGEQFKLLLFEGPLDPWCTAGAGHAAGPHSRPWF